MREVSASRFVRATPATVERALTPRSLVEYEGSFTVYEVEDTDEGWLVIAGSRGVELALVFELDGEGLTYEQRGDGPLETLETTITYEPKDQGTSVRMRSRVSSGSPRVAHRPRGRLEAPRRAPAGALPSRRRRGVRAE